MGAGEAKEALLQKSPEEGSPGGRFVLRVIDSMNGGPAGPFLENGLNLGNHPVQGGSQPLLLPLLLLAAAPQPLDAGAAGPLSGVVERLQAVVGCTVGREGGGQRAGPG